MRIYGLTKLGKKQAQKDLGGIEMKVLHYIRENKTVTDDELYVIGGERYILRRLKDRGLVEELTT